MQTVGSFLLMVPFILGYLNLNMVITQDKGAGMTKKHSLQAHYVEKDNFFFCRFGNIISCQQTNSKALAWCAKPDNLSCAALYCAIITVYFICIMPNQKKIYNLRAPYSFMFLRCFCFPYKAA